MAHKKRYDDKMSDERTPLITNVYVGAPRRRYPNHVLRRFCTVALSSILIFWSIFFVIALFVDEPPRHHKHRHHGWSWTNDVNRGPITHEEVQKILFEVPSSEKAEEWSKYYTAGPHLAGQNYSQALWTKEKWESWGIQSDIVSYDVYLNYPIDHSLSLLSKSKDDEESSWKVEFKAALEEDVLEEDPSSGLEDRVPTFHGYSASGNVTGSFVFVNYGTYQDYEDLVKANVSLEGKIIIAKYGGIFRGLKIKRAQELGAIGALLYSDPGDDGKVTEENGYEAYPNGPARHPSAVQRGSAQFLSQRPGDPTTPGYPSKPGVPRAPVDDATPSIPSIPISYADALPILKALNGHGPSVTDFNKYWNRNLGLKYKGVEYNIGPSPDNVVLNLYNEQNYTTTPLWNVIGIVNGTIPNEVVVIGNHRDAWIAGGAGDPNSGSAVLNEVIRGVGIAVASGWKPTRTIVFASWDGEEYSLIGSTEWVEEYLPWLSQASVAYVNVDVGVRGPHFNPSAAPLLHRVLREVTHLVPSPNQTVPGQTVGDVWNGHISTMGSGSDFTAFQDFAGIPSLDFGFGGENDEVVYQYHSNYDSFHWMKEFGDPGFVYHRTMAQILGLVVAELSNVPVIRFNATDYAHALTAYVDQVEAKLSAAEPTSDEELFRMRASVVATDADARGSLSQFRASLQILRTSIAALREKTEKLDATASWVDWELKSDIPWWNLLRKIKVALAFVWVNKSYKGFERHFLYPGGLDGRSWFKHVVFAPGLWTGYSGAVFPGLQESIDAKDFNNALKWTGIINECVASATKSI
ncbi:putative glutamate carboxypeptidase [Colletotrichum tanaceti]|uniref:Putative glutamate carboxypeptidase n=1 Tax=Colletotrichum tanaceti TaxID=1306861 RepID=A0A4U6XUQ9_9PEZI|nr:putative glutamate carboxypeptidase [Colletotrichum tanaceti]TKW59773.1 putative glutamate carboxypeptidase [Colletotrichum tanaceti]